MCEGNGHSVYQLFSVYYALFTKDTQATPREFCYKIVRAENVTLLQFY